MTDKSPAVLTRLQTVIMFVFIVLAFATVAYRTEVVLNEVKIQNNDIKRVLLETREAAVEHQEAAKKLIDCNTPGGDCFAQQQRQQQQSEARIAVSRQRTIVAALVCDDGRHPLIITACINDLLESPWK